MRYVVITGDRTDRVIYISLYYIPVIFSMETSWGELQHLLPNPHTLVAVTFHTAVSCNLTRILIGIRQQRPWHHLHRGRSACARLHTSIVPLSSGSVRERLGVQFSLDRWLIDAAHIVCRVCVMVSCLSVHLSHRSTASAAAGGFAAELPVGRRYRQRAVIVLQASFCRRRRWAANAGSVTLRADGGSTQTCFSMQLEGFQNIWDRWWLT